jgi:hypothetical protein
LYLSSDAWSLHPLQLSPRLLPLEFHWQPLLWVLLHNRRRRGRRNWSYGFLCSAFVTGKINQIKQNKYKNPDKRTEIIETNRKTYESDSRKSYRDACGFLEVD